MPRSFTSPGGFSVLVGVDALDNEHISLRTAAPCDRWFHVQGMAGAHVLLQCGDAKPDRVDIRFAERLAAQYSKASTIKAHITRALGKNIYKVPGSPIGTVHIQNTTH